MSKVRNPRELKSTSATSAANPGVPKEAALAFVKVEKEIDALDASDLDPVNIDIPRAVAIAVGAAPHLHAMRGQIVVELPKVPIRCVDQIGTYALAAWYGHFLALPATSDKPLASLLEEASPLREGLLVGAEALAHRGLFDNASVAAIREGHGNLDTANDLVALSVLFSLNWDKIQHRTAVEWAEVQRASELGPSILVALGARDQPGLKAPSPADPAQRRQRAFTLFVRAYEECRRAVSYLRWHAGDADEIAPSLWTNRGRRAAASPTAPAPVPPPAAAAPAPAANGPANQ